VSAKEQESAAATLAVFHPSPENHVEIILQPLTWSEFVANTVDRCYFCKKHMYRRFLSEAKQRQCNALLDGSNADDLKSNRPGYRAILELAVQTPLLDAELNKEEIRFLARKAGLAPHNKPSNSCMATRIPEGSVISKEKLELVEKCEAFLLAKGFVACRVRVEGQDAVLQLTFADSEFLLTEDIRADLLCYMQGLGFIRVLLDMAPRF
jgi:pyridinium-3,5-biscarboxylic acid mononucleotide sulfurtransferase